MFLSFIFSSTISCILLPLLVSSWWKSFLSFLSFMSFCSCRKHTQPSADRQTVLCPFLTSSLSSISLQPSLCMFPFILLQDKKRSCSWKKDITSWARDSNWEEKQREREMDQEKEFVKEKETSERPEKGLTSVTSFCLFAISFQYFSLSSTVHSFSSIFSLAQNSWPNIHCS